MLQPMGRNIPRCCQPVGAHPGELPGALDLPSAVADLEPGVTSPAQARAYVRTLCGHHENFSLASIFLPPRLRPPLRSIYAFSRFSDDLADEDEGLSARAALLGLSLPELRRHRLLHWATLLEALPESKDRHPILHCLWEDAQHFHLPLEECRHLLDAFVQDQDPPNFPDDHALLAYCRRSAAPVGRLLLALNGMNPRQTGWAAVADASDRVCAGLQLANFWQDLSRDLPAGRLYIPIHRLRQHGLPEDAPRLAAVGKAADPLLNELLDWAQDLLASGWDLSRQVRGRFGLEIRLYTGGGMEILRKSRCLGSDLWRVRPRISGWDKLRIGMRALGSSSSSQS